MKVLTRIFLGLLFASPVFAHEEFVPGGPEERYEIVFSDEIKSQDRDYYYNFGRVRIFQEVRASFYLRNSTDIPVYINDFDLVGSNAFRVRDNCPRLLFRGQQCRVQVAFAPRSQGLHRADLEIELTPQEDIVVHLRGRGVFPY